MAMENGSLSALNYIMNLKISVKFLLRGKYATLFGR